MSKSRISVSSIMSQKHAINPRLCWNSEELPSALSRVVRKQVVGTRYKNNTETKKKKQKKKKKKMRKIGKRTKSM